MHEELQTILEKVRVLYRKYGIRSVTMDDVSHELGISKKTLYQYVADKDDLVRKVIELEINERISRLELSCADDRNAIEQLLAIGQCIMKMLKNYSAATEYDLKKYHPDLYRRVHDLRKNNILKIILGNLIKGKGEGIYRADLNVETIAKLTVAIIDSMVDSEVITIDEFMDTRFFYEFFSYHIRGIVNEKGLQILEKLPGLDDFSI